MKGLQHPAVIAFLDARSLGRYEIAARDFRPVRATRDAMPGVRLHGKYINYSGACRTRFDGPWPKSRAAPTPHQFQLLERSDATRSVAPALGREPTRRLALVAVRPATTLGADASRPHPWCPS